MQYDDYHAKFVENGSFHIYNRGNNGAQLFYNYENNRYFLERFKTAVAPYLRVYAYALMGNHFHFVVSVRPAAEVEAAAILHQKKGLWEKLEGDVNAFLEERFQRFFAGYAQAIAKQEARTGSLFQKRFQRIFIADDYYWQNSVLYTHHNPIHHGSVSHYEDWHFSSYNAFLSASPTLLERETVLAAFGGAAGFVQAHEEYKIRFREREGWDNSE
jgi:putative transposase